MTIWQLEQIEDRAPAYGWEADFADDEILTRLLVLNQQRAISQSR